MIRGGSWNNNANNLQVGNVNNNNPYNENNNVGFRLASTGAYTRIGLFTDNSTSVAQVQIPQPAPGYYTGQKVHALPSLVGITEGDGKVLYPLILLQPCKSMRYTVSLRYWT